MTDKRSKAAVQKEYFTRIKRIMKTEINSKNTISAINTYAVPSLAYDFAILDWSITELEVIDCETRKLIQKHHLMHTLSDVTRLYLPRKNGGRGLINITSHYKNAIINFSSYMLKSEEYLLNTASNWQLTRGDKFIHTKASIYCNELNLDFEEIRRATKQQRKVNIKNARTRLLNNEFSHKLTHEQLIRYQNEPHVDKDTSISWLKSSMLKRAIEATICAIQEQVITTRYIQKHIHHTSDNDIC